MLSRLCAQCQIWTTITSLSGTSEIFVTLTQTLTRRKNLRFSLTEKCVKRYGSNLRKFIPSVFVASLFIVQWKPPPLRVVEASVLRSADDVRFPQTFAAVPPRSISSVSSTNKLGPFFVRTPQAMTFLRFHSKQCLHQRLQGNGMWISRE